MMIEKDIRILASLRAEGRKSATTIARELGIPRATVQERIAKMRASGLIRKFTVIPDYGQLDRPVTAFILISFLPGARIAQRKLAEKMGRVEGVFEVHLISGEWDILLKVRGRSMEDIGRLVIDRLRSMDGVGRTATSSCFTTIKEEV